MKLLCLGAEDLMSALPMREAITVMKNAFTTLSRGGVHAPQRSVVPVEPGNGITLLMGGFVPGVGLAAKIVSVFYDNVTRGKRAINALVVVLDRDTGEPIALCDGTCLTSLRTGAASGAATELLARDDARQGAIIGCSHQARTQALAIDAARELEVIRLHDRDPRMVERFIGEMSESLRARLEAAPTAREAVCEADIVCTATSSTTPVFAGTDLKPGAHINGIGSFTPEMQEIDVTTVRRARIFIDQLEAAVAEAGDLLIAEREGATSRNEWTELGHVAAGTATGRESDHEITFFKSVGHAVQDVTAAARALETARAQGLGREIEF